MRELQEIIRLLDRLIKEVEETEGYLRRGDTTSALRNINDNRDEMADLQRKWQDLNNQLQRMSRG